MNNGEEPKNFKIVENLEVAKNWIPKSNLEICNTQTEVSKFHLLDSSRPLCYRF